MGLRDRLKKMKNRTNSTSTSSSPRKASPEPPLKYRGKISKEHTDKLHAFSFSDAWSRRRSTHSAHGTMSPGGTMAQSRAASFVGSLRKKSIASHSGSDTDGRDRDMRRKSLAAPPETATVQENDIDDTNVANTGLSRPQTAKGEPPDVLLNGHREANGAPLEQTETVKHNGVNSTHDSPFSTEELEKALTSPTIEAPRGGEIAAH
jgi:hypothetical protein